MGMYTYAATAKKLARFRLRPADATLSTGRFGSAAVLSTSCIARVCWSAVSGPPRSCARLRVEDEVPGASRKVSACCVPELLDRW